MDRYFILPAKDMGMLCDTEGITDVIAMWAEQHLGALSQCVPHWFWYVQLFPGFQSKKALRQIIIES